MKLMLMTNIHIYNLNLSICLQLMDTLLRIDCGFNLKARS